MSSAQLSLIAWEKEQKPEPSRASAEPILSAMEELWSFERLMTPVTMDTISKLRQLYLAAGGHT